MDNRIVVALAGLLLIVSAGRGQEAPAWVDISEPVLKALGDAGKKIAWPGKTAGVAVDRTTGEVYMIVPGQGIWKSADRGASFTRADQGEIGGRCETGYALNFDPAGKRLACFMLDGKCAMTLDAGRTWRPMKDVGRNWDYAAVDWSRPEPQAIFGARHESGGEMYLSGDGGKSWKMIGKDAKFAAVGIFDEKTLVTTQGAGILRSADGGQNWAKVSELQPVGRVMVILKDVAYWLGKEGLLISRDKGATWAVQGSAVDAAWGPMFGKDEKHIMVAGKKGFIESRDAGRTWTPAVALPPGKEYSGPMPGWFLNVGWDPNADVFYASRMGAPTMRLERKR